MKSMKKQLKIGCCKSTPATLIIPLFVTLSPESWQLSRDENKDKNFSKEEPDPSPQTLKLFAEDYIATRKKLPSSKTACHHLINFTSCWQRKTCRTLPREVKKDVLNV